MAYLIEVELMNMKREKSIIWVRKHFYCVIELVSIRYYRIKVKLIKI